MNRKFDITDKELERKCVAEVIARIEEIDGEVGIIAAQDIIDIVTQNAGPLIYNKALTDTRKIIQSHMDDMLASFDLLESR